MENYCKCLICKQPVINNRNCVTCHTLFCFDHLIQATVVDKKCPNCHTPFLTNDTVSNGDHRTKDLRHFESQFLHNVPVQRIVNEMVCFCPLGCGAQVKLANLETHKKRVCTKAIVACVHEHLGCNWQGLLKELKDHRTICPFELVAPVIKQYQASAQEWLGEREKFIQLAEEQRITITDLRTQISVLQSKIDYMESTMVDVAEKVRTLSPQKRTLNNTPKKDRSFNNKKTSATPPPRTTPTTVNRKAATPSPKVTRKVEEHVSPDGKVTVETVTSVSRSPSPNKASPKVTPKVSSNVSAKVTSKVTPAPVHTPKTVPNITSPKSARQVDPRAASPQTISQRIAESASRSNRLMEAMKEAMINDNPEDVLKLAEKFQSIMNQSLISADGEMLSDAKELAEDSDITENEDEVSVEDDEQDEDQFEESESQEGESESDITEDDAESVDDVTEDIQRLIKESQDINSRMELSFEEVRKVLGDISSESPTRLANARHLVSEDSASDSQSEISPVTVNRKSFDSKGAESTFGQGLEEESEESDLDTPSMTLQSAVELLNSFKKDEPIPIISPKDIDKNRRLCLFAGLSTGELRRFDWTDGSFTKIKSLKKKINTLQYHLTASGIKYLCSGSDDGKIRLFVHDDIDPELQQKKKQSFSTKFSREYHKTPDFKIQTVQSLCSHRGLLASAGEIVKSTTGTTDFGIQLWDVDNNVCKYLLEGHTNSVYALCSSGDHLFSGCWDEQILVWDIEYSDEPIRSVQTKNSIKSLLWDDSTRCVFACSYNSSVIEAWDIRAQKCVRKFLGHSQGVNSLTNHFGYLCSGSSDSTVRLWDFGTGICQNIIRSHSGPVNSVSTVQLQDGRMERLLCSGSSDDEIHLFRNATLPNNETLSTKLHCPASVMYTI